jgi:hypothetical protein
MITDTQTITRETCSKCGPNVYAAFVVVVNDADLPFCGHCTNYGAAKAISMFAVPIPNIYANDETKACGACEFCEQGRTAECESAK